MQRSSNSHAWPTVKLSYFPSFNWRGTGNPEAYKERLKNRPLKAELKDIKDAQKTLCKLRLKLASSKKTPPLDFVLKNLQKKIKLETLWDMPMRYSNPM